EPEQLPGPPEPASCKVGPEGSRTTMSAGPWFVGIDVAKAQLDIAVRPSGERWQVPNDPEGCAALVERLGRRAPALIVLEATGGFEAPAGAAPAAAGVAGGGGQPPPGPGLSTSSGPLAPTPPESAGGLGALSRRTPPP